MQSSVLSTGGGKALINPADTAMLLLDHQTGLFQTVKDIGVMELRANTTALAKLTELLKIPLITTTSVPDGPNGPQMPELKEVAPHAHYVPRHGEVNAWDNEAFVKAVRERGQQRSQVKRNRMPSTKAFTGKSRPWSRVSDHTRGS